MELIRAWIRAWIEDNEVRRWTAGFALVIGVLICCGQPLWFWLLS